MLTLYCCCHCRRFDADAAAIFSLRCAMIFAHAAISLLLLSIFVERCRTDTVILLHCHIELPRVATIALSSRDSVTPTRYATPDDDAFSICCRALLLLARHILLFSYDIRD